MSTDGERPGLGKTSALKSGFPCTDPNFVLIRQGEALDGVKLSAVQPAPPISKTALELLNSASFQLRLPRPIAFLAWGQIAVCRKRLHARLLAELRHNVGQRNRGLCK